MVLPPRNPRHMLLRERMEMIALRSLVMNRQKPKRIHSITEVPPTVLRDVSLLYSPSHPGNWLSPLLMVRLGIPIDLKKTDFLSSLELVTYTTSYHSYHI